MASLCLSTQQDSKIKNVVNWWVILLTMWPTVLKHSGLKSHQLFVKFTAQDHFFTCSQAKTRWLKKHASCSFAVLMHRYSRPLISNLSNPKTSSNSSDGPTECLKRQRVKIILKHLAKTILKNVFTKHQRNICADEAWLKMKLSARITCLSIWLQSLCLFAAFQENKN